MKEVDDAPWRKPPVQPAGAKNCGTCALYPCLLVRDMPAPTTIPSGERFGFAVASMIPMPCGGKEWQEKPVSRKRTDRSGKAYEQFRK